VRLLAIITACGILAMGADNHTRLTRCEASGHSVAYCRLIVLGR